MREQVRARGSQSATLRAGVTESHREPETDRERDSKSQMEPKWESQRAIESHRETGRELTSIPKHCFVAKLSFVATHQNTVFVVKNC